MKILLPLLAAAASVAPWPALASQLSDAVRADMPQLMTLYRDLHAHAELSMQEVRTPGMLAGEMRKLGFEVTEHVGKTGLVAVMKNGAGPTLLIRADMDALPVKEQTGLPFASTATGKLPDGTETPFALKAEPGHLLFVVDTRSGDVALVRTANMGLFTLLPAGRAPNAIVDKAFKL